MSVEAYPLQWPYGWPRTPAAERGKSRFASSYDRAVRKLRDEVRMLKGDNLVISSELPITKSGAPYADFARRKIEDPGVAVYFTLNGQERVMARDAYETVHENIMSIAHAIEHMRGLSRHGGDHMMNTAFQGFTALPAPDAVKPVRPWWTVLGLPRGTYSKEVINAVFRDKAKAAHPEAGGSTDAMTELNRAKQEALT
jgi:hypothetical protein